jgi:hypothetical protein
MRYKPRPRQREPFCQSNHERCARRPYVPVDDFDRTDDHPADVPAVNLCHHDLPHREQQSYNRPRTQDQNPSRPFHIWCGLQQWGVNPSGTDYSGTLEEDITEDKPLVSLRTPHVTFPANASSSRHNFIPANPVSAGVCSEQDRNYLSGTHAAGRPVLPGDRSRWFPIHQRTGHAGGC